MSGWGDKGGVGGHFYVFTFLHVSEHSEHFCSENSTKINTFLTFPLSEMPSKGSILGGCLHMPLPPALVQIGLMSGV